jgi:thioredoxin reductase
MLFDRNEPRNAPTRASHGFLTRDGIAPGEFRKIAHEELARYPNVQVRMQTVIDVRKDGAAFRVATEDGMVVWARKIILATGLKDRLPEVPGIREFYGKSLFSCPYCDGWERRDEPLIVISENEHGPDFARTVYAWSRNLILATNGHYVVSRMHRQKLAAKGIRVYEQKIRALIGREGMLEQVVFEDGTTERRTGGFVAATWSHPSPFGQMLGCEFNAHGGIAADDFGRTSVRSVYAAGDAANIVPAQLVVAAASGCRAAIGVNSELIDEED